jgi:23S rRNA (cytosine1962-C5)-methyltransferase
VIRKTPEKKAVLTRDLRRAIKRGHPFIFADAVRLPPDLQPGDRVIVEHDRRFVCRGYADPTGPLAIRVLSLDPKEPLETTLSTRLDRALSLRETLFTTEDTTGYRLVNGEGDLLPGLVVDRYGDVLVLKADGPIAEQFWDLQAIARRLARLPFVRAIHQRSRSRGGAVGQTLLGEITGPTAFLEHGAHFRADVREGQKTGFFLDQREHRLSLGRLAKNRKVINAFGYTGGFSVQCGRFGASHVTTLDIAGPAIAEATANWRANGLPDERHTGITADTFDHLGACHERGERFDLVILDPPAFAPSRKDLDKALAAYRALAELGAKVTAPGGLLFLASCSAHITKDELLSSLEEGLSKARKNGRVLGLGGQPPDHPWPLVCPELAYLKTALVALD